MTEYKPRFGSKTKRTFIPTFTIGHYRFLEWVQNTLWAKRVNPRRQMLRMEISNDKDRKENWSGTCAQKEALLSQCSRTFSLRGRADGNLFFSFTSAGEFHQRSHLALKWASTCAVATFWSFSIVISGTRKVEKWRSICQRYIVSKRDVDEN